MRNLRTAWLLFAIGLLSLLVIPPQWLFTRANSAAARKFPHLYFRMVTRLMGMRIDVKGAPVTAKPCLIVANHMSWLDILVLSATAPMCFIAKHEVARWPLFGVLATVGRTLYIDRAKRHDVKSACAAIRRRLANGECVVLFPEGTSSDGNRLLPFRSALIGAADMEIAGEPVAVQPVTIAYTGVHGIPLGRVRRPIFAWYGNMPLMSHLLGVARIGPFEAALTFHPPVTVSGIGSRKGLSRHCEGAIRPSLIEALTGRRPMVVSNPAETR
jgi:1-acyl-sn-glycerol-3-phosphate acyltransferase